MEHTERKYYIDWLRNIGILLLFPFHTARIFDWLEPNYVEGVKNAFSVDFILATSPWFMPLLFLLAGVSSYYALQKRSGKGYVKERFLRLFVPLMFGIIILVPPMAYYAKIFHSGYSGSYFEFLKGYFLDFSDLTGYFGGFTPSHLWFIAFLFIISLACLPLMKSAIKRKFTPRFFQNPCLLPLVFIGFTVLSALPEIGGKNIFVYAGFFLFGFFIVTNAAILSMIEQFKRLYLFIAVIGIAGMFVQIYTIGWRDGFTLPGILTSLYFYLTITAVLLTLLGYGKRFLDRKNRLVSYFNKAAFPVYVLHHTFLIVVGYYILKIINHGVIPFIAIMIISFCLSIITYEVFKRVKPLAFLLGVKLLTDNKQTPYCQVGRA